MWPIIPATQSLKKRMNLAVEEAVMVASAIGDASPLLGGKGGEGQYLKGGEGRRKEERQCSEAAHLELGRIAAQSTTLSCASQQCIAHSPDQHSRRRYVFVLHQNGGGIGKSIPNSREIS